MRVIHRSELGACHFFARSLNFFPNGGRKTLTVWLPFAHDPLRKSRQTFCLTTFPAVPQPANMAVAILVSAIFERKNAGFSEICIMDSDWEKGVGDEGNAGFANRTYSLGTQPAAPLQDSDLLNFER